MTSLTQHIVIPFIKSKSGFKPGEQRVASDPEKAKRVALTLHGRFVGVVAYSFEVDVDTGDLLNAEKLCSHGDVPDIIAAW